MNLAMRAVTEILVYFSALGVAGHAVFASSVLPLGSLVHLEMQANFLAHPAGIHTQAFASALALALALGPFQFSVHLRQKRIQVHRWIGRGYSGIGVLLGGSAGLYMSQHAYGGPLAQRAVSIHSAFLCRVSIQPLPQGLLAT